MIIRSISFILFLTSFFGLYGQEIKTEDIQIKITEFDSLRFYASEAVALQHLEHLKEYNKAYQSLDLDLSIASYYADVCQDSVASTIINNNKNFLKEKKDTTSLLWSKFLRTQAFIDICQNNFASAIKGLQNSNLIVEKHLGKFNAQYLENKYHISKIHFYIEEFEQAKKHIEAALQISKKIKHPLQGECMNFLAEMLFWTDNLEESESISIQSEIFAKEMLGEEHVAYANALINQGLANWRQSKFKKANEIMLRALHINKKNRGIYSEIYSKSLFYLIQICIDLNDFKRAEDYLVEYTDIVIEIDGIESDDYVNCLEMSAEINSNIGNHYKAIALYTEALEISKKIYGDDRVYDYYKAVLLNALGLSNQEIGEYRKAKEFLSESFNIIESLYGKDHSAYAITLVNLAKTSISLEEYEQSISYLKDALISFENSSGKSHPSYSSALHMMGSAYEKMKQPREAEKFYLQAISNYEELFGKDNSAGIETRQNLAKLYFDLEEYDKAECYLKRWVNDKRKRLEDAFSYMSESEKNIYFKNELPSFDFAKRFALFHKSEATLDLVYNLLLFQKGLQLNATMQTRSFIYSKEDALILTEYKELLSLKNDLKDYQQSPIEQRGPTTEIQANIETLEKKLARKSFEYRSEQALNNVTKQSIVEKLNENEISIEFTQVDLDPAMNRDSFIYAACILDAAGKIHFIPLCTSNALKNKLEVGTNNSSEVNALYGIKSRGLTVGKEESNSLYELIWKPIDSLLIGVEKIFYSPSGLLNKLNLNAISIDEDTVLSDKYSMTGMMSTRSIAEPNEVETNNLVYVIGGVEYENNLSDGLDEVTNNIENRATNNMSWKYLKWTLSESDFIQSKLDKSGFDAHYKTGFDATEEDFKKLSNSDSPKIIHLATHGYFYSNKENNLGKNIFQISEDPLFRSGMILAEANYVWQGHEPIEGKEDGILTAYEISNMNLSNTELVVLSACDTGLGDIERSEGVFGLQRAFKMAGAKYLIMSLWQVPDRSTSVFMQTFYDNLLDGKIDIRTAFNKTQLEMRDRFFEHHQWAGFVLIE